MKLAAKQIIVAQNESVARDDAFCQLTLFNIVKLVLPCLEQDVQVQELKLVNQQDSTGATALHYAAQGGFLKVDNTTKIRSELLDHA